MSRHTLYCLEFLISWKCSLYKILKLAHMLIQAVRVMQMDKDTCSIALGSFRLGMKPSIFYEYSVMTRALTCVL